MVKKSATVHHQVQRFGIALLRRTWFPMCCERSSTLRRSVCGEETVLAFALDWFY